MRFCCLKFPVWGAQKTRDLGGGGFKTLHFLENWFESPVQSFSIFILKKLIFIDCMLLHKAATSKLLR